MNFQRIILCGEITNNPKLNIPKNDPVCELKFKISVDYRSKNKVIFPIVVNALIEDLNQEKIVEGREVLVEGFIDFDEKGNFFVFSDWTGIVF